MAVTQKDIAKKMGLSPSLVSRVLSGRAREVAISEETIEKVSNLAEELGYIPNTAAQSLKGIPSRTIGVMVGHFNNPFFGQIIDTLLQLADRQDYSVVLSGFHYQAEPTTRELRPLLKHQLDGIIIVGSSQYTKWTSPLIESNIPIAHVGHGPTDESSTQIAIDENRAMQLLLEHLQDNGCSRIAFIGSHALFSDMRLEHIQQHAAALNMDLPESLIKKMDDPIGKEIKEAVDQILEQPNKPDAIVCSADTIAILLIDELSHRGISVPKDIAVVGVNDIPFARLCRPSLTTILQPTAQLVEMAFDAVIHKHTPEKIVLEPKLMIRKSSLFGQDITR